METTGKFIGYYRLSCKHAIKENNTSLGIEAQKAAVRGYVSSLNGELINEVVEIESGKNNDRPLLLSAIELAEKTGSILVISRLDRLSREVSFLFSLKNRIERTGIKIKCLDMPNLDTITLGIYASIAQHERETISKRTILALNELKKQGVKLGKPENLTSEARTKGVETIKMNALNNNNNRQATAIILSKRNEGYSFQKTADFLNSLNFRTRNNKLFTSTTVKILFDRATKENQQKAA